MTKPMTFSQKVDAIPEALSIYINQIVYERKRAGDDVTVLSLGEAFFDIPLYDFHKIDYVKGYHYSDSQGVPLLREKIANYYQKYYDSTVNADQEILITAGSKIALFLLMQTLLNPGEEVLIFEPAWLSYQEQVRLVDAVVKFVSFDTPIEGIEKHFTEKTKLLIINNPNNPSGRVYTREELTYLYKVCRENGVFLIVDEAYSDFILDGSFVSLANIARDHDFSHAIVVNSLSKNMGMSGWRVGYVISHPEVIQRILTLNQHLITCAPTVLQLYMAKYFDDVIAITLPQVADVVAKRERIRKQLDSLALNYLPGFSTFYFFVDISGFSGSSLDFALYMLLKHRIAVVPGSAYGSSTERFVRVSIGAESEERIFQALQLIKDTIHNPSFNATEVDKLLNTYNIERFHVEDRVCELINGNT